MVVVVIIAIRFKVDLARHHSCFRLHGVSRIVMGND